MRISSREGTSKLKYRETWPVIPDAATVTNKDRVHEVRSASVLQTYTTQATTTASPPAAAAAFTLPSRADAAPVATGILGDGACVVLLPAAGVVAKVEGGDVGGAAGVVWGSAEVVGCSVGVV